jgi:hypothetical protein
MTVYADALARAAMNALLDELEVQGVEGVELQDILLSVIGIAASLAAINGVSEEQIGHEALNGVLHGRLLSASQAVGTC